MEKVADNEPWLRVGWVARGLTYTVSGIIAFSIAFREVSVSGEATQKGALALLGDLPLGSLLLIVMAAGLLTFSVWELSTVIMADRERLMNWIDHLGKLIGVGFYGVLAFSAMQLVLASGAGGDSTVNRLSRWALQHPLGRLVVATAGAIVLVVALRRGVRTFSGDFDDSLVEDEMGERHRVVVEVLGRVGEFGRALALVLVGSFLVLAAASNNSSEAQGLDRRLLSLRADSLGRTAIVVVAIGFFAYGAFCAVSAPARRLPNSDDRSDG